MAVGKTVTGLQEMEWALLRRFHRRKTSLWLRHKAFVNDIDRSNQASLVQVVPQQPAIFNTSIVENVRYNCPEAPRSEVSETLKAANCETFVESMKKAKDPFTDGGYLKKKGKLPKAGFRNTIDVAILQGALKPNPDVSQVLNMTLHQATGGEPYFT